MADFTIYIGNRNYSSWSLRAWLMLKQTGAPFKEVVIPLYEPNSRTEIMRVSPSGKVPALKHGRVVVWESLAIGEYLAELFPKAKLWPESAPARATARAVAAEMHAGFMDLRRHLPMNMRRSPVPRAMSNEAQADLNRIAAIWRDCRKRFGHGGPFLCGRFGIADAMYAPVVSRIRSYHVVVEQETGEYCDAITAHPFYQEWMTAAKNEPMIVEKWEI
jgi:glutathione S-transferase